MLKKFLRYYRPHKRVFCLDMAASFTMSMVGIFYPIVTRAMLEQFTQGTRDLTIIVGGAIVLLSLYALRMGLEFFIQYQGHVMGVGMQAQMRREMFEHLQKLPYSFYDGNETGKIMSRMTNDLMDISELAHHGPENVIISTVTVLVSFCYLATIHLGLALILFLCVPLLFFVALRIRKRMRAAFTQSRLAVAEINNALESSISGIRVTKAFTNTRAEQEKFEVGNLAFVNARKDAYKAMGQFHSTTTFITNAFNVVVLLAGGLFLYAGSISLADYSAYVVSVSLFLTPIRTLIGFMEQYQNGVTGFQRFLEILDQAPEADVPGAQPLENVQGEICLEGICCDYGTGREVLHGVDLKIPKGQTFALVGPSGGGKTTLCHLIPRFYTPSGGRILIDGQDVAQVTAQSLRKSIGIVQQDVYLFNDTVRQNILYGRPDATDQEVEQAARLANIHDDILQMEKGYDTVIGERGVKLSGGQKQRLSIARVFLKDPPILILDEATSALDNVTEMQIQESLDRLCHGRTTLVVAHRLSTVKNANTIAVVENGRICEQGSHKELMELGGTYHNLYAKQFAALHREETT